MRQFGRVFSKNSASVRGDFADSLPDRDYVPPDPRHDPRLDRDMTSGAKSVSLHRPKSWAALSKRRTIPGR